MNKFHPPEEADYLEQDRSREIREICDTLTILLERCKIKPENLTSTEKLKLRTLPEQLRQMGITAGMNVLPSDETDKSAYKDPVYMAEYVAGQLLKNCNSANLPITEQIAHESLAQSRDISPSLPLGKVYEVFEGENKPPEMLAFQINLSLLHVCRGLLDLK